MKIPKKLQSDLVDEIYRYKKNISGHHITSTNNNDNLKNFFKGELQGLEMAIMIINSWNEPNHGKVTVQIN